MIKKEKGTQDFFGKELIQRIQLEEIAKKIARKYGFEEIRTPTFEKTSLFQRGVGDESDIVQKEMFQVISSANMNKYCEGTYDLQKKGISLRPEGTASVVRAFLENKLQHEAQPTKLFYLCDCYRNERPQAGRYRQFHQFGVEVFGSDDPFVDAEVMALAHDILHEIGIKKVHLEINSIGSVDSRTHYNEELLSFLEEKEDHLCSDCKLRMHKNPLRILDCKNPKCQEAIVNHPIILDYLTEDDHKHFESVQEYLDILGIAYEINPNIVRGLDYYTKTAFEFVGDSLGAQSTICGGGRYNDLVELLGGPQMPGVGFGMGIERLHLAASAEAVFDESNKRQGVYIFSMIDQTNLYVAKVLHDMRNEGVFIQRDVLNRSFKSNMKYADKNNFAYIIIIGEDELHSQTITIKNLESSEQKTCTVLEAIQWMGETNETI